MKIKLNSKHFFNDKFILSKLETKRNYDEIRKKNS